MNRRVLFGWSQMHVLYGYCEAADMVGAHFKIPKSDFRNIIFGTLIQAGADHIETLVDHTQHLPNSQFLRDRFIINSRPEWLQSFLLVNSVFDPLISSNASDSNIQREISKVVGFLTELIYAIHRGHPMALVQPLPKIELLNGKIPVQLYMALTNLFETFVKASPNVIALRTTVETRDVAVFQQIISSRLFSEYKESHDGFSNQKVDPDLSIERIEKATNKLCKNAEKLIEPRIIQTFLLPLVSKGIGAVFGSFPAAIADQCRVLIEPLIDPKRRVVIYHLDSIASKAMSSYIQLGLSR